MADTKKFTSGLDSLLPLLLANNSSQSQSSTSTANTGPLQAVYDRASTPMTPDLYQNLITSIFQTAQKNVPGMTASLANATGSRSSNNSPLALALNEQNNQSATAAAQAILQQQNTQAGIAANAASGIAGATRGTNTNTATKAGGSLDPMTGLLGGFLLNQADKRGWIDKGFNMAGDALGSVFGPADAGAVPAWGDMFGGVNTTSLGGIDLASAGSSFAMPDFGSVADVGAGFMDYLPDLGNLTSGIGDFFGGIGDFFGFADGGQVDQARGKGVMGSRMNVIDGATDAAVAGQDPNATAKLILASALTRPAGVDPSILGFLQYLTNTGGGIQRNQYADGGTIRNVNNMGGARSRSGMGVINGSGAPNLGGNSGLTSNNLLQMITDNADSMQLTNGSSRTGAPDNGWHDSPAGKLNMSLGNPTGNKVAAGLGGTFMGMVGGSPMGMLTNYLGSGGNLSKAMKTPSSPIALIGEMLKQGWAGKKAGDELGKDEGAGSAYQAAMGQTVGGVGMDSMTSRALAKAANAISHLNGTGKEGALDALFQGVNMREDHRAITLENATDTVTRNGDGTLNITSAQNMGGGSFKAPESPVDPLSAFLTLNDNFGTSGSGNGGSLTGRGSENAGTADSTSISMQAGGGYSDGGLLRGPGTGTSDHIKAKSREPGGSDVWFSTDEFVIPADVTAVPGMKEHFQNLINTYHKPVRR